MHDPNDAPAAATGGQMAPRSARRTAPVVVVVVAAVCAGYASLLGHWFYSDDFVHLLNNRDLGWQGFFRFLLFADYGERAWVYWRPGWMLLFQLVFAGAGTTAWPYYLVALLLHAAAAAVVTVIGHRASGSRMLALAGGLLFALMPAHCEAVAWISATYNVIPAAICLGLAGWASWRFALDGGWRTGVAIVLLVGVSLTFKEAAYGFPLVFAAACVCARGGKPVRWGPRVLVFAALVLLVGWHYLARSKRSAPAADTFGLWSSVMHFAATYLRGMVPLLPADDGGALLLAAAIGLVVMVLASSTARFLLLWTMAAFLPYVALAYGERFAYFVHVPAVLLLVRVSADIAQRCRWRHAAAAFGGFLVAVAIVAGLRLPAALQLHREKGDECRRVWQFVDANGLAQRPELVLDVLPGSLDNGFESMLQLFGGSSPRVVYLQIAQRPPFLLYLDRSFGGMPGDTPVLQLVGEGAPSMVDKAALIGDQVALPFLSLAGDWRLAADEAAAADLLRAPGDELAARPVLFAAPPCEIAPPGVHDIEIPTLGTTETTFGVACERPCLLVIASPVPFDLEPRGRVLLDGQPVPVQRADLLFHAVCMPAGRHVVTLRPLAGGG